MTPRARSWLANLVAVVVFSGLALWQTRQAFFSPVPVILGGADQPDWTGTMWTWWWTWTALLSGQSPLTATHNLFPVGLDPVAQYNVLDGILFGWLIHFVGPTRGYNLAGLTMLASAGWTGMWMCRRLGVPRWPAVAAGVLFQTSAMVLVEVTTGRLSQALVVFSGLAFVGLLRGLRGEDGQKGAVWTGMWTALSALTYWYAAVFVAVGALPAAVRGWRQWRWLGTAVGVCLLMCVPAVVGLVGYGTDLPGLDRVPDAWMADDTYTRGRYGLGMATGYGHQPLWPVWSTAADLMDKRLSLVLVVLAGVGGVWGPRKWRLPLVGAAVAGWTMTLGPWLKSPDGAVLPIPLPWLLFDAVLPYFDRLWWPERFELTVMLACVPLAGMGLAVLAHRWGARTVGVGFIVVFVAEQMMHSPYQPLFASPPRTFDGSLYAAIDGPMVTTPVLSPLPDVRHALWLQVLHEQPVTAGLGEHLPGHVSQRWTRYVSENSLLDALSAANEGPLDGRVVTPADIQSLQDDGLRWVVSDTAVLPRGGAWKWRARDQAILKAVWGTPDVQTDSGAAWRIEPIAEPVQLPNLGPPPPVPDAHVFQVER